MGISGNSLTVLGEIQHGISGRTPAVTTLFEDTFTDTNGTLLTAHTPEIGTWEVEVMANTDFEIQNNNLTYTTTGGGTIKCRTQIFTPTDQKMTLNVGTLNANSLFFIAMHDTSANVADNPAGAMTLAYLGLTNTLSIQNSLGVDLYSEVLDPSSTELILEVVGTTWTFDVGGVNKLNIVDANQPAAGRVKVGYLNLGGASMDEIMADIKVE